MDNSLNVCINQQPAGELFRDENNYVFRYQTDEHQSSEASLNNAVSLTMPPRKRDYSHSQLFPIFEMHLPEGYLLALIQRHFGKLQHEKGQTQDDLSLLQLLAPGIRGRLNYDAGSTKDELLTLESLIHPNSEQLFDELVQKFALKSPLSGVQPKVLARVLNKATLKLDDYIVKAWGPEYPELALNEFWCMTAVKNAGIDVPEFYLSDDNKLFIMKRFDLLDDGSALGFEDLCVLQARQRDDKYSGSYEQLAKTLNAFISPPLKARSFQKFFKLMVINQRLQNGDAHLKNFGILYPDYRQVQLAPAYDVVSTTAYVRNDMSALTMMGSRKWWPRKHLLNFGVTSCGLTLKQANTLYDECLAALAKTAEQIKQLEMDSMTEDQQCVLEHLLKLMTAES